MCQLSTTERFLGFDKYNQLIPRPLLSWALRVYLPVREFPNGIQCDIQSWWEIFLENKGCGQARKYFMKELVGNLDLLERIATFVARICSFLRQNI